MAGLIIAPRARLFHGHDWVYATEIKKTFGNPSPGDVITLKDFRDRPLGSAIYNPSSQIVARRFSRRKQDLDLDFFKRRIAQAVSHRKELALDETVSRILWSESDGIPGLIVDRYHDHLCVQTLTLAMEQRLGLIHATLVDLLNPSSIVLRNDSPSRKAEGLQTEIRVIHGTPPKPILVSCNGIDFEVDLVDGQKTGLYLDQLNAHREVAKFAKGKRILDCFANQGGFALACAKAGASKVSAVEISGAACAAAIRNARGNSCEIEVIEDNAFDFLKNASPDYDLIILDPPSSTRNKKSLSDAMRGYKEIHLRALKLLPAGGVLSSFCCSYHASRSQLFNNLADASVDAKKTIRLIQEHHQRADHPVLMTIPETSYLKGITVEVIASR